MRLGLFTAALPERSGSEVIEVARDVGFASLEVAAWPRDLGGVTHLDVTAEGRAEHFREEAEAAGIALSALSCYANPLDPADGEVVQTHLRHLVDVAGRIGVPVVGAFVGRNPERTVQEDLEAAGRFLGPLVEQAADVGVDVAIENCPMPTWHPDRYPGNLAYSPELWDWLGELGCRLNYDPSHLRPLGIDPVQAIRDAGDLIVHVQAKDVETARHLRNRYGFHGRVRDRAEPDDNGWWQYRTPGHGELDWRAIVAGFREIDYEGDVAVEHEDDDYAGDPDRVISGLKYAHRSLHPIVTSRPTP